MMTPKLLIIQVVLWLTRVAGVVFSICGIGFFVTAWMDGSFVPIFMGIITIAFGVAMISIHAPTPDRLEYRLLRSRRKST